MKRLKPTRWPRRKLSQRSALALLRSLYRHFGPRHWWPGETPFEVMVGAVLTQNTAWTNVEKAILNLKERNALNAESLKKMGPSQLAPLIRPAGYFNIKAKRLKNFIVFFWNRFGASVRRMKQEELGKLRKELLEVNGVGPETADSILLYALGKQSFVVDAYTRRIFSRHRYLQGDEDYEVIRNLFMTVLPRRTSLYNEYHAQLVEVGKEFCGTVPHCESCPLRRYL